MKHIRQWGVRCGFLIVSVFFASFVAVPSAFATTNDYTWTNISTTDTATHGMNWHSLASSASGQHLVAGQYLQDIWTSSDYGATWTDTTTNNPSMHGYNWQNIASDSTGQHLALAAYQGDMWTSSNYGANWTDVSTGHAALTGKAWFSLASDSTGKYLAGAIYNGDIYTSNDYGATWTDISTTDTATHGLNWITVSLSGTGQYQAANAINGGVWISSDYGATWTKSSVADTQNWAPVQLSADGRRIVAQVSGGDIYTGVNPDIQDSSTVPNIDDANGDGVSDDTQGNVAGSVDPVTGGYALAQAGSSYVVSDQSVVAASSEPTQDSSYTYPAGLMNFTVQGGTPGFSTTITQYYYGLTDANFILRKYDPTTKQYSTIPGATITHAVVGGQNVIEASYQVTDGGPLDEDGAANGVIVDPAGLAVSPASAATLTNTGYDITLASAFSGSLIVLAAGTRYASRRKHYKASV